jgi:hypothetical protein
MAFRTQRKNGQTNAKNMFFTFRKQKFPVTDLNADPVVHVRNSATWINPFWPMDSASLDAVVFIQYICAGGAEFKAPSPKKLIAVIFVDKRGFAHIDPDELLKHSVMYTNIPVYQFPQLQYNLYTLRNLYPTARWIDYVPWTVPYFTVSTMTLHREWLYRWAIPRSLRADFLLLVPIYAERLKTLSHPVDRKNVYTCDDMKRTLEQEWPRPNYNDGNDMENKEKVDGEKGDEGPAARKEDEEEREIICLSDDEDDVPVEKKENPPVLKNSRKRILEDSDEQENI